MCAWCSCSINGVPSCANDWLLDEVAPAHTDCVTVCLLSFLLGCPQRLGVQWLVSAQLPLLLTLILVVAHSITSDCDADNDVYSSHHYTKTPEEAVRDVLRAGSLHSAAY